MLLGVTLVTDRTKQILEDLEATRENLLALSDDIWQSIDHNDAEALEEGVQFKRTYNEKMSTFDSLATELSELVQQFTSVSLESDEQSGAEDDSQNERIVRELNRETPHAIDEDFTFKRPFGFILDGTGTTGITTWKRLYEVLCRQLHRRDEERFLALIDNPEFISNRGHHQFSRDKDHLRNSSHIVDGVYTEVNLSANSIRNVINSLLDEFSIPLDDLQILLREDRDAEE